MNLPLPWPFEANYMQLALIAGLVVGMCAPLIGTFLVQKRMSLMGDGVGHVAFAGVSVGMLTGVWPIWTALIAAVIGAVLVEQLRMRTKASGDFALAVLIYSGVAGGAVMAGLAGSLNAGAVSYLFGSILTVTHGDMFAIAAIGVVVMGVVGLLYRVMFAVAVDEETARVAGIPVGVLNLILSVLTALMVVAAMRVVGVLLVAALMILPVGTSQVLAGSFRRSLLVASLVGASSVVVGLIVARLWGLAPGGTIVLVCVGIYLVASSGGLFRRFSPLKAK